MPRVLLVRHAVTTSTGKRLGGRTPAPLSDHGREQAEALAQHLSGGRITAVYASPIVRTHETGTIVATRLGLPVHDLEGVQEFDYGRWTDRPLAGLRRTKLWRQIMTAPSRVTFPEGESFADAQRRAVGALDLLAQRHTDRQTVVVVSHADIIKALVAHYVGVPLDLFQRLVVSPASISVLALPRTGAASLLSFNGTSHLDGVARAGTGAARAPSSDPAPGGASPRR